MNSIDSFPPTGSGDDGSPRSYPTLDESSVVTAAHSSDSANAARHDGMGGASPKDAN